MEKYKEIQHSQTTLFKAPSDFELLKPLSIQDIYTKLEKVPHNFVTLYLALRNFYFIIFFWNFIFPQADRDLEILEGSFKSPILSPDLSSDRKLSVRKKKPIRKISEDG